MSANPEAIAWYVKKSEDLLDDLRNEAQALCSRGVQVAGFSGAVLALAGANAVSILDTLHGIARLCSGVSLLAGAFLLVASVTVALRGAALPRLASEASTNEVASYASDRFINEPDLWRVHLRTIRVLAFSIRSTTRQSDE